MKIIHVVGARPNFMKVDPVMRGIAALTSWEQQLVHTGQHYDKNMSDIFFSQLGLPKPDAYLEVGSGSHAIQTAEVMMRFEATVMAENPDWVFVYGDVNSTVAAALVCAKLHIPVVHVEAGLRSGDRTMPEEINRLITDQLADLLFTPSLDGNEHLLREGVGPEKIHFVGNVMIDTLVRLLPKSDATWPALKEKLDIEPGTYGLVTLHRPSNVDNVDSRQNLLRALQTISADIPLIFPVHPRTRQLLEESQQRGAKAITYIEPLGYLEFLALQKRSRVVITDSGGVQEETTFLRVPCFTVRPNTERPVTVEEGTNTLITQGAEELLASVQTFLQSSGITGRIPELWDGNAGERIAQVMLERVSAKYAISG